jgi:two-component system sensor histidine kinase GlrK
MNLLPNFLRSLSLRRLVLFGFALAILPLALAVLSVVFAVEELAALSHATIDHVAMETRQSRLLEERLTAVERKGRQYLVWKDPAAREAYELSHREFQETAADLGALTAPADLSALLQALVEEEEALYQRLISHSAEPRKSAKRAASGVSRASAREQQSAAEAFQRLHVKASKLSEGYSAHVDDEAEGLSLRLLAVQDRLLWQAATLVPVGLGIISYFLFLLLRPIRQMDVAIRAMGGGELTKPITISGPRDLKYLGSRLEWLRTRLFDLEQAKQRFLRNVSHEIKTPLANLHEGVELLADEVVGELNPEQREIARIVIDNAERLEGLISELIQFGRVDARANVSPPEKVDVRRLIEDLIEDYRLQLRNNEVTVQTALSAVTVMGNAEQLRTVFDNLLSNAVKYSPPGGRIDVSLASMGSAMELEIEDDGPGIAEEERMLIFEPFYQGRTARELGVKGSGFGLAIAAECVAAHQGTIVALDPREGHKGARFRVQLPKQPKPP